MLASVATLMGCFCRFRIRIPYLVRTITSSCFWKLRIADVSSAVHRSISRARAAPRPAITMTQVPGPGSTESRKTSEPLFSPCVPLHAKPTKSHLVPPRGRTIDGGAPAQSSKTGAARELWDYNILVRNQCCGRPITQTTKNPHH